MQRGSMIATYAYLFLTLILFVAYGCAAPKKHSGCDFIGRNIVGPEDLHVDESVSPARLIVSSNARRLFQDQSSNGIYEIPLTEPWKARPLPIDGATDPAHCSLKPHGISVATVDGIQTLFVINKASPECQTCPCRGRKRDKGVSVEQYRLEPDGLVFLRRHNHAELLPGPNDLDVHPSGDLYVSNLRLSSSEPSIVRLSGDRWSEATRGIRLANGVAVSNSGTPCVCRRWLVRIGSRLPRYNGRGVNPRRGSYSRRRNDGQLTLGCGRLTVRSRSSFGLSALRALPAAIRAPPPPPSIESTQP